MAKSSYNFYGVTISVKNYLKERKRAMSDTHPRTFDLRLTIRVGAKLNS